MNTSTGRKSTLSLQKKEKILISGIFLFDVSLDSFCRGKNFVNHHDPSQEKARIFKAPISRREHRERVISEAAVAFWGRSWSYKRHGGGVPSEQVIRTDSKQSTGSRSWLHTGILLHWGHSDIYGHVKSSDRLLYRIFDFILSELM